MKINKLILNLTCSIIIGTCSTFAQKDTKDLKRKVAIGRFTNVTKQAQSIFYDQESDQLGKQAADILATKLVASEKFILVDI